MAAIVTGAIIAGASSLIGSGMSMSSANKQARMQKQFAKKGISWRVADAKKAGLHPLYALGAQLPSYSPVQNTAGQELAAAGQNIGDAISRRMTPIQKQALQLEIAQKTADLNKTAAETNYIEASMRDLWAQRLSRINETIAIPLPENNVKETGSAGTVFGGQAIPASRGVPPNFIEPKAPSVYSSSDHPGVAAGNTPMMREFTLPGGLPIMLPGGMQGDPSEALESLTESPILMWSVYKANREKYGPAWASEFRKRFLWGDTFEKMWMWSARNRGRSPAPRTNRTRQDYR